MSPAARLAGPRWWSSGLAWALWALVMLGLASAAWLDHLLRQAGTPEITLLQASSAPLLVAAVSAATIGAVLAGRRPRHSVGWLLLAVGLGVAVDGAAFGYVRYGVVVRPGALPAASYLAGFSSSALIIWLSSAGWGLAVASTARPY